MLIGKRRLQAEAGVFVNALGRVEIVEAPVGEAQAVGPFAQGVADLVQNHLGERVVGIERLGRADRKDAGAVPRGIYLGAADDLDPHLRSGVGPDKVERIGVGFGDVSHNDAVIGVREQYVARLQRIGLSLGSLV